MTGNAIVEINSAYKYIETIQQNEETNKTRKKNQEIQI